MGYYTHITGEISINPPLSYAEVKTWHGKHPADEYAALTLKTKQEPIETDQGVLTRTTGVALTPYEESFKAYTFTELMEEFVAMFATKDRTFTGRFDAEGESAGDIWRAEIRKGKVVTTTVWLVWPEDLDTLRKTWQDTRPIGDDAEDASRLVTLRAAVTDLLDHAHRQADKGA